MGEGSQSEDDPQWSEAALVLGVAADELGSSDRRAFEDWLLHNEEGFAFEELVQQAADASAPRAVWLRLAEAAELLKITVETYPHEAAARVLARHLDVA